jgi:hypothetical protein
VPRRLLIGVRETDKLWLAPGPAHKLHSDRNAVRGKSSWNHDRGKTGRGRKFKVDASLAGLTDHARLTCERWVNKGVNAIVSHRLQNGLANSADFEHIFQIVLCIARFDCFRAVKNVLQEGVIFLRSDDFRERAHGSCWMCVQVSIKVGLEFLPNDNPAETTELTCSSAGAVLNSWLSTPIRTPCRP